MGTIGEPDYRTVHIAGRDRERSHIRTVQEDADYREQRQADQLAGFGLSE